MSGQKEEKTKEAAHELEKLVADEIKQECKEGKVLAKEEVFLRVYDLSFGNAKRMSEQFLGFKVDGIWHTSIEVFGKEFFFANGLVSGEIGAYKSGLFTERVSLGFTDCTADCLADFFETSKHAWTSTAYNLLDNNCNHFSDQLAHFLVEKGIPNHILELPEKVKTSPAFKMLFPGYSSPTN